LYHIQHLFSVSSASALKMSLFSSFSVHCRFIGTWRFNPYLLCALGVSVVQINPTSRPRCAVVRIKKRFRVSSVFHTAF
jgi:hypothetical protein